MERRGHNIGLNAALEEAKRRGEIGDYIRFKHLRNSTSPFDYFRFIFIKRLIGDIAHGSFLEIGCNTGYMAEYYDRSCFGLTLCDRDIFYLRCAKEYNEGRVKKANFCCADIVDLPFKSRFDCIVCFEVLEHVPKARHEKAVLEILRVAKKGARIYLSTPNKISFPGLEGKIMELFFKDYKWNAWDLSHAYIYAAPEFATFIKKFDVSIKKVWGFYFLPGSLLARLPYFCARGLGWLSYFIARYAGSLFPFKYAGFTTIIELIKK
ncbi:MAG: class I SAM-dependent methyltransferase [Candidatus Omnitrophica bacterium]|nr:class I SAM-dependent methyltransferase [Candidatus Omnitrophota bacterium]